MKTIEKFIAVIICMLIYITLAPIECLIYTIRKYILKHKYGEDYKPLFYKVIEKITEKFNN